MIRYKSGRTRKSSIKNNPTKRRNNEKCPFCAEDIQDAAIKCRYCGEKLGKIKPTPKIRTLLWCAISAGLFSGTVTAIVSLTGEMGFDQWNLINAGLFYGFAFGVFKKSRVSAILLFLNYLLGRIDIFLTTKDILTLVDLPVILFLGLYICGIVGAFMYHSLLKRTKLDLENENSHGQV